MIRRRHLLIIALVALAARTALLVLFYVIQGRTIEGISGGDAGAYLAMAHYVYYGHDLSSSLFLPRPLLFPVLAASVYQVIGERPMIIVTINLVLNVITCLIVYRIAETIGQTPRTALYAGLLAALYPAMITSSITFMVESLFLFLFALALLWFARYLRTARWRDFLSAAAILACATLARLATLLLPILWIGLLYRHGTKWKQQIVVFLVISALPGAILTYRNWYYGGIPSFSTDSAWMLLFMRAVASEHRATGMEPSALYAKYVEEIEIRLGHTPPPEDSIRPEAIWGYFQPSAAQQAVVSQMAIEKNLAYPGWYILNTFYGLHRILALPENFPIPDLFLVPLHYGFVLLAVIGAWCYWRENRRWLWLLGLPALLTIGLTVALETSVLTTRHGLGAALPMFLLAAYGIAAVERWGMIRWMQRFKRMAPASVPQAVP